MSFLRFTPTPLRPSLWLLLLALTVQSHAASNVVVRVMAANLTSGTNRRYESPGLRILKGLKPDIVALQEFNYQSTNGLGVNTPMALREMVDAAFGTNFVYFRETGYDIPNGIISRYPILTNGSWVDSDPNLNDRGFAWARIDVPGSNDLFVVSAHLKASSSASDVSRRAAEALELKSLISTNFPTNAWVVVAGDFNIYSESEGAVTTLTSFLSDQPVPADLNGDADTNQGRNERYDRVFVSFSLTNLLTPVVLPSRTLTNGLVFVSSNYTPLSDVAPVQSGDSSVTGMQHMGVVKDFRITLPDAPAAPPAAPVLSSAALGGGIITFALAGTPGTNYVIQVTTNPASGNWIPLRTNLAPFSFNESNTLAFPQRFYRAVWNP